MPTNLPPPSDTELTALLGELAYNLAKQSALPAPIKTLFAEARPYAEGRGIRFTAAALGESHHKVIKACWIARTSFEMFE